VWTHTRSKIAHTLKSNPDADVTDLRVQLKAEHLAAYIQKVVDSAPPLTPAQRDRLALLLKPADAA